MSIAIIALVTTLSGCAMSERQALQRLDLTHEVIRQGSNLLSTDPELGRFPIEVDGFKGDMRLKGEVATAAQKSRAERILWSVKGVRSVDNKIQVQGNPGARS